jgi:hypothetical protein
VIGGAFRCLYRCLTVLIEPRQLNAGVSNDGINTALKTSGIDNEPGLHQHSQECHNQPRVPEKGGQKDVTQKKIEKQRSRRTHAGGQGDKGC